MTRLVVNGHLFEAEVQPHETLVDTLRNRLELLGVRVSCRRGECGCCTVLVDGRPVPSCLMLARQAEGKEITTIEGLARGGQLHPVQQAFVDEHGMQCGFCTPGVILTTKAFLEHNVNPTREQVAEALAGHICRCGGYPRIIKSALRAAGYLRREKE